ncbi:retrotransposon protein, putative, ty1-copia subclass [Tanacetum coccineum]|uniref:Retrotransposon protein, putative, ty1-copia subclass n=1 Tax=Tanacetum coccineum TaxID=301880 RepID=A0ABQ5CBW8_9ASTR
MKGYVDQLERLGYILPQDLIVGLILNGHTKDFDGFVRNYNMHNMRKMIGELHAMLIEYEKGLPKKAEIPQVMMIKIGKIQKANKKLLKAKGKGKANGKGNDKQVYIPKPKNPKPSAKEHPAKDDTCHHCKEVGHWKRNCPVYLAKLLKKKKQVGSASSSGIFIIELFAFPNKSWVCDTGCGTHICITKQGFREARKLKQGALYLYVGNGVRAQVEAIGSYDLVLPNGLVICLDNCHYAPSITRVSKNNVFYFNVIPSNGIYEIDMHDLVPNVNSIYNVSTKRAKHNLDSTYLWHWRLAHISKKHIEKLQQEGLLKLTDDESFDQCVSCLSGKMTRKLFPHRHERATDLLGIIHTDLTPPGTPQHNGVSERRNLTVLDMVRSMMNLTTLPLSFWDYALESATRIFNMVPTKKVDKTPYELWYGKVPNPSYLKDTQRKQWVTIFYFPPENKIVVARYAEFFEKNLIIQEVSGRAMNLEEIQDEDTSPSEITSEIPMDVEGFEPPQEEDHSLGDLNEPTSYKATMLDSESNKWIDAMNAEIQSMMDNMVWVLVDLPPGSRLVAKGYTQLYGVDYEETFSPVPDIRAIRILISIAAYYDYEIWQMDVKTAFLNGYLDEYIYMIQPKGFVDPNHPRKVCKLQRSIYDLKQASRSFNKRFDEEIKRFDFDQNLDEPCVYQKASGSNVTFLILYVDDIIIMGNYIPSLQSVKDYLGKYFAMKDLGEAAFILGIKIYRDRSK